MRSFTFSESSFDIFIFISLMDLGLRLMVRIQPATKDINENSEQHHRESVLKSSGPRYCHNNALVRDLVCITMGLGAYQIIIKGGVSFNL